MRKNRILELAAQAVAGGVGGITLAIGGTVVGAIIGLLSTSDFMLSFAYAFYGELIGYALGTLSGVYVAGKWLRRERSFWILFSWCMCGVGFAVFITQWWLWGRFALTSTLQSLQVFIPAVVLAMISHLFDQLFGHLKRHWMTSQ